MEVTFQSPHNFKFNGVKSTARIDGNKFYCSRMINSLWLIKEAVSLFEKDGIHISKAWVENLEVDLSQITKVYSEGPTKNLPVLLMMLVTSLGLTAFSYFTDSLFWWNFLIYGLLILFGFIYFLIGKTQIDIYIKPSTGNSSYKFQLVATGKSPQLVELYNELRDII